VTFIAAVVIPSKPPKSAPKIPNALTVKFAKASVGLQANYQKALNKLAKKLVTGAAVTVRYYTKGQAKLAKCEHQRLRSLAEPNALHSLIKLLKTSRSHHECCGSSNKELTSAPLLGVLDWVSADHIHYKYRSECGQRYTCSTREDTSAR